MNEKNRKGVSFFDALRLRVIIPRHYGMWGIVWACAKCGSPLNIVGNKMYFSCACHLRKSAAAEKK